MVCPCALGQHGGVPVPRIPKELKPLSDGPLSRDDIRKGKVRHVEVPTSNTDAAVSKDARAKLVSGPPSRSIRRAQRPMSGFLSDAMRER